VPLNINLAPAKATWKAVVGKIVAEVLLFISLIRNDKMLWAAAWVMHVCALIVIVASHLFGIIDATVEFYTPYTIPFSKIILYIAACFAFPLIITLLILLIRRILTKKIRRISIPTDYVAIGLILTHVLSGTYMSFCTEIDMNDVAAWGMGLFTFHPMIVEGSWIFAVHCTTCFTTLMYFPFSKLAHMAGIFFSMTRNMANTNRATRQMNPWEYSVKAFSYMEQEDLFRKEMNAAGISLEKDIEE